MSSRSAPSSPDACLDSRLRDVLAYFEQERMLPMYLSLMRQWRQNGHTGTDLDQKLKRAVSCKQLVCTIHDEKDGILGYRAYWPVDNKTGDARYFEHTDPRQPLTRFSKTQFGEIRSMLLAAPHDQWVCSGGRFNFSKILRAWGPTFLRGQPLGFIIDTVQILLNQRFLRFHKGKISIMDTEPSLLTSGAPLSQQIVHNHLFSLKREDLAANTSTPIAAVCDTFDDSSQQLQCQWMWLQESSNQINAASAYPQQLIFCHYEQHGSCWVAFVHIWLVGQLMSTRSSPRIRADDALQAAIFAHMSAHQEAIVDVQAAQFVVTPPAVVSLLTRALYLNTPPLVFRIGTAQLDVSCRLVVESGNNNNSLVFEDRAGDSASVSAKLLMQLQHNGLL